MPKPPRQPVRALIVNTALGPVPTADQRDSLMQALVVRRALRGFGWRAAVRPWGPAAAVRLLLRRLRPDLAVNLVEDVDGSSRHADRVPALLEAAGVPFTGSGSRAMALTTDKLAAKRHMRRHGIPTAPWLDPDSGAVEGPAGFAAARWIVKPVAEEASVGLDGGCVCRRDAVAAVLAERRGRFGGAWFAEAFVDGREFNVSVLEGRRGPVVLPVAEIGFAAFPPGRPRIVDYAAKWEPDSFAYANTPRLFPDRAEDRPLLLRLAAIARACWHAFGLKGYARVDFRVDAAGRPWVLEVNANPCLSPDAGFAAAAARAGLRFPAVVRRIAAAALETPAAVWRQGPAATSPPAGRHRRSRPSGPGWR